MELTRTTGSFGCEGHNRWSFCVLSNQQLQWRNQPIQSSCLPPSAGAPPFNSSMVSSERSNYNSTWTAMQNPLSKKQHRDKKRTHQLSNFYLHPGTCNAWIQKAQRGQSSRDGQMAENPNLQWQLLQMYGHILATNHHSYANYKSSPCTAPLWPLSKLPVTGTAVGQERHALIWCQKSATNLLLGSVIHRHPKKYHLLEVDR